MADTIPGCEVRVSYERAFRGGGGEWGSHGTDTLTREPRRSFLVMRDAGKYKQTEGRSGDVVMTLDGHAHCHVHLRCSPVKRSMYALPSSPV